MDVISLIGIAIGLSMDAFAVSITNGAVTRNVTFGFATKLAASFGLFQAAMPMICLQCLRPRWKQRRCWLPCRSQPAEWRPWRRQHRERLPFSCFCPPKIAVRFILADCCVRDTVPHHLLFACLYDNKSFTENKQLFWFVTAGKRAILAMLVVTNLTSPSKHTNTVNGVCAYC